ncbi:MAG: HU family DNA-binding protein [Acidobacteriota bacterium]
MAARKTTKKAPARKKTTKKAPARAAAAGPKPLKLAKAEKPRTRAEVINIIAEQTDIPKKQVAEVFETLKGIIGKDLGRTGPGAVNIPGMAKVTVTRKPATKARKGTNPFTGEEMVFKAKPARNVVKIRPLKALKDLV